MTKVRIVTPAIVQMVENYVCKELHNAEQYDNSEPLDESGIWSLHLLAAEIYACGFDDGERIEAERGRYQQQRRKDAAQKQNER